MSVSGSMPPVRTSEEQAFIDAVENSTPISNLEWTKSLILNGIGALFDCFKYRLNENPHAQKVTLIWNRPGFDVESSERIAKAAKELYPNLKVVAQEVIKTSKQSPDIKRIIYLEKMRNYQQDTGKYRISPEVPGKDAEWPPGKDTKWVRPPPPEAPQFNSNELRQIAFTDLQKISKDPETSSIDISNQQRLVEIAKILKNIPTQSS